MKVNKHAIVLLFLSHVLSSSTFAQNTETEPLDSMLIYLEDRFHVVFTYADANIKSESVTIQEKDVSLASFIAQIEEQTNLRFEYINDRYIAIRNEMHQITISGTIIDQTTGEILTAAVVYSNNSHTVSDEEGFFSIELNLEKDSVIIIRHVGYHPLALEKGHWHPDSSVFRLEPDIREFKEVKLNYIARGIQKLYDGSVQLNVQNLEVLPGLSQPDVLQAIQILPGIQSINESVSEINTRGGTNDQNLVLWDGIKMYQTGHFFGLISAFNSHLIHQTNVIKNGTSAAYDEGISGTIDMRQQDYQVNNFSLNAGIDMLSADLITKVPVTKKFSFILGARHSINGLIKTPTYKSYFNRAFEHTEVMLTQPGADTAVDIYHDFSFYDVNARLLYDISEKDKIRLSILNNQNMLDYEERATIRDTLYTRQSHLMQSNLLSNLNYTRNWSEESSTSISAFASNYFLDGRNVSVSDDQNHLQENEVLDWGLKLESKNSLGRYMDLSGGYQFKEVGIRNLDNIRNPDYIRDIKDVLRIHSLYVEIEIDEMLKGLYLRTGLRTNYYTKFSNASFEPRVAINYRLTEHFSWEAQAERKSQYTTQLIDYQTDFLGVEKRRWVLANNESVPLLKSQQVSTGFQYNNQHFLISVEGYMKEVNGIITPSQGFQNQFEFVYSTGNYYARGVEVLVNKRFSQANTWATYTLARNNYLFPDFTPSIFPNNLDISHSLSLGGRYTIRSIELSAGFNYHSGRPYTQPAQDELNERDEIVYDAPNSSRLKHYMRLDMSGKYTFSMKKMQGELGISVWNVLNRDNMFNVFYQVNQVNEIEQIIQNTLGITPNVSLRLKF